MSKTTSGGRVGLAALTLAAGLAGGLVGPTRAADAAVQRDSWQVPALQGARITAPLPDRPRFRRRLLTDEDPLGNDPGRQVEEAEVTLRLTGREAGLLRRMLHEAVTNDLDLLEDTLHQHALVDGEAVARIALAVRLDVGMG